jgi:hypothetical protein
MSGRISLALVLHNHQPVDNFGWVIEETFEQAYQPMLEALERHPGIRAGLHYSGPLLEWLRAEQPEFLARLRALVERDQVEVLGGGLYEPVLAALPHRDRLGQLRAMAAAVTTVTGRPPGGAWLAERVWEPDLPSVLADAGYAWTVLDDAHLRSAAVPEDAMWGPYVADDEGRGVTVFATEQGLRYRIPFRAVDDVIAYLRDHATEGGERLGTMGDDGEKFGAWPTTFEHCWGRGRWVDAFFDALEANGEWLTTVRPGDWLAGHAPLGRVAIPTGSYAEMGEWALPVEESAAFAAALASARREGAPEARWLRGAIWRNFQVKYREVNDLHKQMLRTSGKVAAMDPGAVRDAALDHLYRGQSNDAYWHGLFGGVYLPHLRSSTLAHLIAAEDAADLAAGTTDRAELVDLDLDARDEALLATGGQVLTVELDEGAGIGAWDLRAARHAVTAVLRRRPEAYHARLLEEEGTAGGHAAGEQEEAAVGGIGPDGAASIHGALRVREPGLGARLRYDPYERRSALVRCLPQEATPHDWAAGGGTDLGDPVAPARVIDLAAGLLVTETDTAVAGGAVRLEKVFRLGGGRQDPSLEVSVAIENRSEAPLAFRFGLEWATTMLGGGGNPQAWWDFGDGRLPHDGAGSATGVASFGQGNDWLGLAIDSTVTPADAWWAPIETVSNSEGGVERVYQGSALLLSWQLRLGPGDVFRGTIRHAARIASDERASA